MEIIDLETLKGLPEEFINRLEEHNEDFARNRFLENLQNIYEIQVLIKEINDFCEKNKIIGFHYTRANKQDILKLGLIPRSGYEIRKEFCNKYGYKFSPQEKDIISAAWQKYFPGKQQKIRDYQIYFNLTQDALTNGGAEELLNYYGGEQVYNPIYQIEVIGQKLQCIGTPMILKCILNPKNLFTDIQNPWGSIAVSSYHRMINTQAHVIDQDAHQKTIVSPQDIEVITYKKSQH